MKHIVLIFVLLLPLFAKSVNEDKSGYSSSAVVFAYHRFGNSKYPSTNIKLEQFQYQLDYFEDNNYNVWPLSKIINHIIDKKPIPPKTVALTIDDAYKTVFSGAYPMLKEKNYPFTVFVNTNPIDNKSINYMTWEQMRIMQEHGAEFANHSLSHPFLLPYENESNEVWKKRVKKEILKAQKRLQEEFGSKTNENPKLFSYTFGEYNIPMADIVRELGFVGVAQVSGPVSQDSDLRAISRFAMSQTFATENGFKTKLNTLPLPIKSVSVEEPVIQDNNPPKLRIKLKERITRVGCFLSSGDRLEIDWISKTEFEIVADIKLKAPRDRYTCTAPAKDGKWYWYSHLWIIKQ